MASSELRAWEGPYKYDQGVAETGVPGIVIKDFYCFSNSVRLRVINRTDYEKKVRFELKFVDEDGDPFDQGELETDVPAQGSTTAGGSKECDRNGYWFVREKDSTWFW